MLLISAALAVDTQVTTHLDDALASLWEADTSALTAAQSARRSSLLDALDSYIAAGQFPENRSVEAGRMPPTPVSGGMDWETGRTPVFVDAQGSHCAVGYLLAVDGRLDLVDAAVERDVYGYLSELATPELQSWATESGFTMDELARIQPSYEFLRYEEEAPRVIADFMKRLDEGKTCTEAAKGVHRMHFASGMDLDKDLGQPLRKPMAACALQHPEETSIFAETLMHYFSRFGKPEPRPDECEALRKIWMNATDRSHYLVVQIPKTLSFCETPATVN